MKQNRSFDATIIYDFDSDKYMGTVPSIEDIRKQLRSGRVRVTMIPNLFAGHKITLVISEVDVEKKVLVNKVVESKKSTKKDKKS